MSNEKKGIVKNYSYHNGKFVGVAYFSNYELDSSIWEGVIKQYDKGSKVEKKLDNGFSIIKKVKLVDNSTGMVRYIVPVNNRTEKDIALLNRRNDNYYLRKLGLERNRKKYR